MAVVFSMFLINFELKVSGNQPMTIISMISSTRHNQQEWVHVIKYVAYSMLISEVTVWLNSKFTGINIFGLTYNKHKYIVLTCLSWHWVFNQNLWPTFLLSNTSSQERLFNIMYHMYSTSLRLFWQKYGYTSTKNLIWTCSDYQGNKLTREAQGPWRSAWSLVS